MGSIPTDLEALKSIFADRRTHLAIGKVIETELASDRSCLYARCDVLTQDREVIAKVCWDACGPNAGVFQFPQADDLVLLAFAEGDNEQCFLTNRLSSRVDKIPTQASSGDLVMRALAGKNTHLLSDTKIYLGKGSVTPAEALVLGNVLKTFLEAFYDAVLDATQIGHCAVGPVFLDPSIRSAMVSQKSTYLTTAATNILSQLGFTERGT